MIIDKSLEEMNDMVEGLGRQGIHLHFTSTTSTNSWTDNTELDLIIN